MAFRLPPRPSAGHKGTFGTVAILGGNLSSHTIMLGGPAFVAEAALRSGAGLAVFVGERNLLAHLIELVPQAIGTVPSGDLNEEAKKWQSVVIGPGLGINKKNIKLINDLLKLKIPTVVDADGLNMLAEYPRIERNIHGNCVLTPHPKEFERLADTFRVETADELATKLGCCVVLKNSVTLVTNGKHNWRNDIKNPALATGGTGDVLSGLIGGIMAQYSDSSSVFDCAKLGVEIHTRAGARWREEHGSSGLFIGELLELIPETMENMRSA